jgi:hypothetical protein
LPEHGRGCLLSSLVVLRQHNLAGQKLVHNVHVALAYCLAQQAFNKLWI